MKKIVHILFLLSILSLITSCAEAVVETGKVIRPIKVQKVSYANSNQTKIFPGTAENAQVIDLSFRSGGIIRQFNIQLGQKVRKGQLLAKLDNVQTQLAYEQTVAQMNSAKSQLKTRKQSWERTRILFEKGNVGLSDLEAAKNAFRMAEQDLELAKRNVDIQKEQLSFHLLYAPKNGVIANVDVEVNENVSSGQQIATLNVGKLMDINTGIPESIINSVSLGDTLKVDFPSLPNTSFLATISEIAPSISPISGVFPIKAKLLGETDQVRNGMSTNVFFNFDNKKRTDKKLFVPAQAVSEDKTGQFVYLVVTENNQTVVKKQPIVIGDLTSEGFEIRRGLSSGQEIAVAGLQSLWDGMEVKLKS